MAEVDNLIVKVSLDGVDFQRGIDNINRTMKVVRSEFQATSAQLNNSGNDMDKLRAKADSLSKQLQVQEARVQALNRAYQESVQKNGEDAAATQNLAIRLNTAIAAHAKLEGELQKVNREIQSQSSVLGKLGKDWQQAMNDAQQSMGNAFDRMRSAGVAITGIGAGLAGAFGLAVKAAGDFESSMNTFRAVSSATGDQMQRVRDLAVALGNDMTLPGTSAKDAADAMTELAKAGLSVQQAMDAAKGTLQLAAAAQVDNAQAATIVGQALNAFGLEGNQASHVADLLANSANASAGEITDMAYALQAGAAVAHMAGQSLDDTVTAISLMANAGITGSDAGTSLKSMFMALISPTKEAANTLREYGIQIYDAQGKMLPLSQLVDQFSTKLKNLTPEQRNAALATIFGSDAVRAASVVLTQGTEAYDKMRQAVERQGGAQDVAAAKMQGFNGALEAFKNSLQTLAINAGSTLLPAITNIVNKLSELVNWFGNLPQGVQTGVVVFGAVAAAAMLVVGPLLMLVGMLPMIAAGFAMIGPVIAAVAAPVGIAVAAIAALVAIGVAVYTHWDQIRAFLAQTWNAIATTAQTVWSGITGFFSGVWNGVTTAAQTAWNGIVAFFQGIWNTITGVFQSAWNAVGPIVTAGWENVKAIFTAYFQTIWSVVSAAWETIKTIFATAILVIYDLVTGQWDKIGQVFQAAGEKLWSIVSGLWDQIKQIWSGAFQTVAANTSQAWEQVKGLFTNAWNNLVQIVSGLWDGIKQWFINAGESIKTTVSNMWTAVVNFFLSAPGRIVAALANLRQAIANAWENIKNNAVEMGKNVIQGFINGIWNLASWAEQRIREFFGSAVQWAKHVLGIASPSKVFAEIGGNIAQGLAVGIQDESGTAIAAVTALANQITDQFEASSARLEAAQNELAAAQARLAEIQKQQAEEKDRQERASLEQDIANAQARQQIVRQEIANLQQKLAAYEQQQKDTASIKQEIARQEQQLTELQQTEAEKRSQLAQKETQAQIDAAQARVDALKKEQDALKQEQDLLSQMQDAYQKYMSDVKASWDDYQKKVSDVNAKLTADIQKANDDYNKAVEDRAKTLRDFVGLFDAITPKEVSGQSLLDNLRGQVDTFEQWQANMQALAARGVDQGLIDELRQMGPKAAAEVAALNTLTDAQLSEYVALWRQKNEDAKQEATTQLTDLAAQTQQKIADLRSQAAAQLAQYQQEWAQKTQQIHDDTIKKLEDLVQQASKQGFDMVAKLAQAIEQALPQLSEAMSGIPGLGASSGGQDQVSQAQKQTTGIVQAAQTQKQGVVTANVEMFQTVLQTWTDGSAQIAARQAEIRDKTLTTWQQIQQQISALWQKMYVDMQKKWNDMKKFLFDTADQVSNRFESLVNAAQRWGVDLMGNFIAGIWSQFDRLQRTLEAMAEMVDSYMPHSPAKVGPLSRLDEWGPALVQTFAEGIRSSLPSLEDVISRMAALSPAALGPALVGSVSASTTTSTTNNTIYITVSGGGNASDIADQLMRELQRRGVKF